MNIEFKVIHVTDNKAARPLPVVYLVYDNWDDFNFKTLFVASLVRPNGSTTEIGSVKIARIGQKIGKSFDEIPRKFSALPDGWFSVGQDVEYYKKLCEAITLDERAAILAAIGDVAFSESKFELAENEGERMCG